MKAKFDILDPWGLKSLAERSESREVKVDLTKPNKALMMISKNRKGMKYGKGR